MDTILSGQGAETASETEKLLQQTLDSYSVGLLVKAVNFQKILPPPEVKEAFDDANNAGNNQQQFINDAAAYMSREVPLARGEAARILAGAEGYKAAHIATAAGDAQRHADRRAVSRGARHHPETPVPGNDAERAFDDAESRRPEWRKKHAVPAARQAEDRGE
jgi:regulator of protease activity HflC (stomatin/prohibitin superfamily)